MKVLVLFDLNRHAEPDEVFSAHDLKVGEQKPTEADVLTTLGRLGHDVETLAVFDDVNAILEKVRGFQPDVVFNLTESFHADRANESNIPALLELMQVPYTGAGPESLLICKDKPLAKKLLAYHDVPLAKFLVSPKDRPLKSFKKFSFPAFVKPIGLESSDGIALASFVRDEAEALERVKYLHEKLQTDAMIEEYIEGRELYLSVLGNRRATVLPSRELFFRRVPDDQPKFATFKAKWDDTYRKRWGIKNGPSAPLPEGLDEEVLSALARKVYRILKIKGPSRIDIRITPNGEPFVLEANPNPSLAKEDDFAQAAAQAGIDYDDLIQKILEAAITTRASA